MAVRNNPFKPILKMIPAPLRNRYFVVLVLGAAWIIFFDKHDVMTQWKLNQSLNNLEADKSYYKVQIEKVKKDKEDLNTNKEKFAREHYFMKKDKEDVFIFVEE
ncbi:MAG: cell division protein DivIC [Polaribacter sp.]|jgi:cell division protein DivIC